MNFSPAEIDQLVNALLTCPTTKDHKALTLLVSQLRDDIKHNIPYDPVDRTYAANIVEICLSYDGGINELIDRVYAREKNSKAMRGLDNLSQELFGGPITHLQLRALKMLLAKSAWEKQTLYEGYKISAPREWHPPILEQFNEIDACHHIVNILADGLIQTDGSVPLLKFVEYLANHIHKQPEQNKWRTLLPTKQLLQQKLYTWLQNTKQEQDLQNVSAGPQNATPFLEKQSPYLLVTLTPDSYTPTLLRVQAWLLNGNYQIIEHLYAEDEALPIEDALTLLDNFLERCGERLMAEIDDLIVEFSLPRHLIRSSADHWETKGSHLSSIKVGLRHKVVVRSLERAYDRRLLPMWKSKWATFQDALAADCKTQSPFVVCSLKDCVTHDSLYSRVRRKHIAGLGLTLRASELSSQNNWVFDTIIDFGIPVALWTRHDIQNVDPLEQDLGSFVSNGNLADLPQAVWDKRLEAFDIGNQQHLGYHLTLLWDDPNRLPPDAQLHTPMLQPPAKKGKNR